MSTAHDPTVLPADLPAPQDDGAARHLEGLTLPSLALPATDGSDVDLAALAGRTIVYIYPRTGRPGQPLREAAERLHLPFAILSDAGLRFTRALRLPTFAVDGMTLQKRMVLIIDAGVIAKVFYPVFPPDQSAAVVAAWLRASR